MMRKEYLYGVLYAVVVAVAFGGGYLAGQVADADDTVVKNDNTPVYNNSVPFDDDYKEMVEEQNEIGVYYILKDENKSLNLYKVENGEKALVKGIEFDTIYLPAEDRERLKKGIKLEDVEDGYELIEDFIS